MSQRVKQERPYPGVGVTTKLLFYFLIFMMLMLLVLWIFQVLLLNLFYRNTKMNEMEQIAGAIEQTLYRDGRSIRPGAAAWHRLPPEALRIPA